VLKTSVLEFPASNILSDLRSFQFEGTDELPDVPVLPETLLTMEFLLQESPVDLRGFTEVVLGDLGATIQILRLAGREYGSAEDGPVRIEDCISDLGLMACFNAAAQGTFTRGIRPQRADFEIWMHSREIAKHFRLLAEETGGAINPDQAYMCGLLHALGSLPGVLGWQWHESADYHPLSALKLAEQWCFPRYVKDFFCEIMMPYDPHWSELLATAHQIARGSWARCPVGRVMARSLA
jgi:hypothetical protein